MSILSNSAIIGLLGAPEAAGGEIERSVRFNSSDSAYLSRTPASAGNRKKWTWSGWVKRARTGEFNYLFDVSGTGIREAPIRFDDTDSITVSNINDPFTGIQYQLTTSAVYRDPSAWYHIVVALDTTQTTSSDRLKLYVNGSQVTVFATATYPAQNTDYGINSNVGHYIGRYTYSPGRYLNGYLAEIHFIDGQALTPSSFAETNATTGQWVPKAYTGSYGTNGFKLDFADNSAATAAALGKDTSGNGNNWTPNNLSVTAGAGNDSLVDTPTSYGTDTGAGGEVRGNYCTWNPLGTAGPASSNGNLDIASSSTAGNKIGTILLTSGKWYWECVGDGYAGAVVGVGGEGFTGSLSSSGSKAIGYWFGGGIYWDGGSFTSGIASYTTSDVIGVAVNMDAGTVAFYKNNSLVYTATFGSGTVPNLSSGVYPGFNTGNPGGSARTVVANFGQRSWAYAAPAEFKALCDTNLPAPVVAKPSTVMDVKLYTGNGSTQTISGLSFSPDLVWIKERNAAADHALYDSVRGVQQQLESNTTTDETTESTGLTAFNSDGFALSSLAQVNTNTDTYVAWCWDESATAGFDIVTYTGNGSARTISHGLGVAPNMIIVKARTTASTDQGWPVYHSANTAAPATDYLLLNSTAATADLDTVWNDTAPTSSVFSVGTNALVNTNNDTYVAYLFSAVVGYSSFGSYTGNGSADGPFVYTGFRPRWVMIKRTDGPGSWYLYDAVRNAYNVVNNGLFPNLSEAEASLLNVFDFTANGFKLRDNNANYVANYNANGGIYLYCAFAENPFKYARAR